MDNFWTAFQETVAEVKVLDQFVTTHVQFECAFFDVVQSLPLPGLNLFLYETPARGKRNQFIARVYGEMAYNNTRSCTLVCSEELPVFLQLMLGTVTYLGMESVADLGKFHIYTLVLL
jgi:hypothetical protein